MISRNRCLSGLFATALWSISCAQMLSGPITARGSGILQTCDTSMHVDFDVALLDNYSCQFQPVVAPGNTTIISQSWQYYADETWWQAYGAPTIPYYSALPYPMCLTVEAFDQVAMQSCSTAVCKIIQPVEHALCAGLTADFTISSVQDSTVTFQSLAQFTDGIIAYEAWSFGDGTGLSTPSSTNTFSGPGPFEVCLTVVGAPPENCVAQVCQWLYMGPGGLPCEALIEQGFLLLQAEDLVGVIDTSRTSGMNVSREWDFGDGAHATGLVAAHSYSAFQQFDLCGTLRAWGPLLADTCVMTLCQSVWPFPGVGVGELVDSSGPYAWPSPCDGTLQVMPPAGMSDELLLLDATGRIVRMDRIRSSGALVFDVSGLVPGAYTVLCRGALGRHAEVVLKQ